VWVRWDSRILRVLDLKLNLIATHLTTEPGRFSTDGAHIASKKINTIENGITYFLGKIRHLGPSAARWAEAVVAARGIEASRTFQGLLSLCKKYSSADIDRACDLAWRQNAFSYRVVKAKLEADQTEKKSTMEFMDSHPIIRSVSEYSEFVHKSIQRK
jgi:hypothetical protein